MTSSSHIFPPLETNEDRHYLPFLGSPISQTSFCSSSSSSSVIRPTAIYPSQNQQGRYNIELLNTYQGSQEVDDQYGGSRDHQILSPPSHSTVESGSEYGLKLSISEGDQLKEESPTSDKVPVSWMSSKMRLMKKMINSDRPIDVDTPTRGKLWLQNQMQSSPPSNMTNDSSDQNMASNSTVIRTCSDCNTTRTPLWRSGPKGPKSLCNACGIRQRKARRAMAAAAASSGGLATDTTPMHPKMSCTKKKSGKGHTAQLKKQCKLISAPLKRKNLCFEDFVLNLSNNLSLHRVISQDETEAAILLMALSYGLVSN